MRLTLHLIRCFAVLAILWVATDGAAAHGGHSHAHHHGITAKAPVSAEKAIPASLQSGLRSAPSKLAGTLDVGSDCDGRGCCPGPCAACGGLVLVDQPEPTPPTISTAMRVIDPPTLVGLRPHGIRKPPKSFA